ncbi:MAG: hypothetical protein AAF411_00725 [Myxococcota bacterium]
MFRPSPLELLGRRAALAACLLLAGCTVELGSDPLLDPALPDANMASARPALDADFFFCFVQPEVITPHRCASDVGCHTDRTALRLDPVAETVAQPACAGGRPVGTVDGRFYTNLARSRAETRASAARSDFYRRPLGRGHPVTLFREGSREAAIVRAWIEGTEL